MIGVVFNKEDRYVASSGLLATQRDVAPDPLVDVEMVREQVGRLPLLHTVDLNVQRLNPNYYLDLNNMTPSRFWPGDEDFTKLEAPIETVYDDIIARCRFNIGEIAKAHKVAMPITGGQDSRILLGCAQPHVDEIDMFYTHITNYAGRIDDAVAQSLCQSAGVPHETHDRREFHIKKWRREEWKDLFQITSGGAMALPNEYKTGVIEGVEDGAVVLRGHHTDILRAVYVFRPKPAWKEVSWQLRRLLIVPREMFSEDIVKTYGPEFEAWQATLPDNAMEKAADFMFLELFYAASVGMSFPAMWRNFYMSPFSSRRLIGLSLQFNEKKRRKGVVVRDIVERAWPALSEIPYDYEAGLSDLKLLNDADDESEPSTDAQAAGESLQEWRARLKNIGDEEGFYEELGQDHTALHVRRGDILIVTFENLDHIRDFSESKMPWGYDFVEKRGWSMLGMMAHGFTWYRDESVYAFFDRLRDEGFFKEFKKVIFYGASMGGYAAAAFSAAAPGSQVVLISPQATLSREDASWESRYHRAWSRDFSGPYGYAPDMVSEAKGVHLFYDPTAQLDAMHAALFRGENVTKFRCRYFGHRIASLWVRMGVLKPIVEGAISGTLTTEEFYHLMRSRRETRRYQKEMLARLQQKGRPWLTKSYCAAVMARQPGPIFRKALRQAEADLAKRK
ncbi:hypothetical protein [Celeribacter sp. PS-C1]|uniref:hypothetical protein n=1 Tax=Celeribacter sp. PS-C1 TaxID=2820813 RepID=UPI001CA49E0A|nr:hypothetical protein [Celeribacter sp. PS-C1]MBW6418457.1 hypothetical protein [Celeribacter sp. PS-C1]